MVLLGTAPPSVSPTASSTGTEGLPCLSRVPGIRSHPSRSSPSNPVAHNFQPKCPQLPQTLKVGDFVRIGVRVGHPWDTAYHTASHLSPEGAGQLANEDKTNDAGKKELRGNTVASFFNEHRGEKLNTFSTYSSNNRRMSSMSLCKDPRRRCRDTHQSRRNDYRSWEDSRSRSFLFRKCSK